MPNWKDLVLQFEDCGFEVYESRESYKKEEPLQDNYSPTMNTQLTNSQYLELIRTRFFEFQELTANQSTEVQTRLYCSQDEGMKRLTGNWICENLTEFLGEHIDFDLDV